MTWLLLAALAAAPRVQLTVDACVDQPGALDPLLALELSAPLATGDEAPGDQTRVSLSCEHRWVLVEVTDPTTGKSARRRIDPGAAVGTARRRLLALATAELITASWLELAVRPVPIAAPDASASPEARAAASQVAVAQLRATPIRAPMPWLFSAQIEGFTFFGPQHLLGYGVRLGLERELALRISLRVEVGLDHGSEREPLGSLDLLRGWGSLGALVRAPISLPLSFGLGARVGVARLQGQPDELQATDAFGRSGVWAGGSLVARLRVADADRGGLSVAAELGVVAWPFVGLRSDGRAWGVDGGWFALQIGWELPW